LTNGYYSLNLYELSEVIPVCVAAIKALKSQMLTTGKKLDRADIKTIIAEQRAINTQPKSEVLAKRSREDKDDDEEHPAKRVARDTLDSESEEELVGLRN
jgi:hypothetical protein